ncbi:MAG: hypothetical protein ACI3Z5_00805 [Paludibacteraceae bacterium]
MAKSISQTAKTAYLLFLLSKKRTKFACYIEQSLLELACWIEQKEIINDQLMAVNGV